MSESEGQAGQRTGSRRGFLGVAAAGIAGVMLAPGIRLIEIAQAATTGASPKVRWGMLIDTTKCATGCNDCVTACNEENGLNRQPPGDRPRSPPPAGVSRSWGGPAIDSGRTLPTDSQWIRKVEIKQVATGRTASLPVMCQHCSDPPCVDVCPTGASFKRADGIVLVDRHSCIGCRYCVMACPYQARSFVHEEITNQNPDVPRGKGTVESCTLCVHRIDRGDKTTACAQACSQAGHGAIVFGDLNDPGSEIARRVREVTSRALRADLRLDPGVRYEGL